MGEAGHPVASVATELLERVNALADCGSCGERLDPSLTIDELLAEPYNAGAAVFTDKIGPWSVKYRLPMSAVPAGAGLDGVLADLVASCVVAIAELADPLGSLIAQRDRQAETRLGAQCAAYIVAVLDAFSFLH